MEPIEPTVINALGSQHSSPFSILCGLLALRAGDTPASSLPEQLAISHIATDVIRLAARERVIPALELQAFEGLPRPLRASLSLEQESNRRRNAIIGNMLAKFDAGFSSAGIKVAALKGAAWVHEDPHRAPWRSMIDIDLAVEAHDLEAAAGVLVSCGFSPYFDKASKAKRDDSSFHTLFRNPEFPAFVELHRDLGWRRELLPVASLLEKAAPGLVVPSDASRALHAIIHWQVQDGAFERKLLRLKDMLDIARFLQRKSIDWRALLAFAEAHELRDRCEAAFAATATFLKADWPEGLPRPAQADAWASRAMQVYQTPALSWRATQIWRIATLWRCERISYRLQLEGATPSRIALAVYAGRLVRLPLLVVRLVSFAARDLKRSYFDQSPVRKWLRQLRKGFREPKPPAITPASPASVFSEIYRNNRWGGTRGEFYSGPGSDAQFAAEFAAVVNDLIDRRGIKSVVDLGCGDFRVGQLIARDGNSYIGVDVVPALIERNRKSFSRNGVSFHCLNLVSDDLPQGELCILRQVLQHLSNAEIAAILKKIEKYPYALIAEHHPDPTRLTAPNQDRKTAFDTRVESNSGVFLELAPFNVPNISVLARLSLPPLMAPGERLAVYLIDNTDR